MKALAAFDNDVPFYVALPSSTIDWSISDGLKEIEIEERSGREVTHIMGRTAEGALVEVEITAPRSEAANPAFDVTPARLVAGLITERGIVAATQEGLASCFPERSR
jgi:methylthioribose-1-phosphate isomerase